MVPLPKPDVIVTHESDLDGLVSGLLLQGLARRLFDVEVRLEAYHYHGWRQRQPKENAAWVCDLAFEPRLDRPNWVVIDHHPTETKPKNGILVHDLNKSATKLSYELCQDHDFSSPALDQLVHWTNVGDLFLENDPEFVIAGDYANLVKTYGFWNLHALIGGKLESLIDHPLLEVMAVKRRIEDPIGLGWSKQNVTEITPTVGFVDTVVGNNNLIVHQLLEQRATPYPVLLTMFRKPAGSIILSFRSRNGEALKVAERFQGGGHPNACGATLPRSIQNVSEAIDYLRKILNPPPARNSPLNNLEGLFAAIEAEK